MKSSQKKIFPPHRFCTAPMMEWTDRPCRSFFRLLSRRALLYGEMIHAGAVIHGDRERLLAFPPRQHPLAMQLGGNDPAQMAKAARIGWQYGYDEININAGCPSGKVRAGAFGAFLMLDADLSARIVEAVAEAVPLPVTVKCRIGVDEMDSEKELDDYIDRLAGAGCRRFVIHARKAWLDGLSPRENRDVPPLDYQRVYRLKQRRNDLQIIINGGIENLAQCRRHLVHVDGVMLGRAAYHNPFLLAAVDSELFGEPGPVLRRRQIVEQMLPIIEEEMARSLRLNQITRHLAGLYRGQPGARRWRRMMCLDAARPGAGPELVEAALAEVDN